MMLISGIQGALLNLNPLIKADGYYALSQFLNIDNLREESFTFLRVWAEKYILRRDIDLPPSSRRYRRIFFVFGVAAIVYSVGLLAVVLFIEECPRIRNWTSGDMFCLPACFTSLSEMVSSPPPGSSRLDQKTAGVLYDLENHACPDVWGFRYRRSVVPPICAFKCLLRTRTRTWKGRASPNPGAGAMAQKFSSTKGKK